MPEQADRAPKELSIAKNTLYNTVGSGFYLVCQWLITVLAGRLGSVESGGILTLAMSVTNIFYTLSVFGVRNYQVSDFQGKYAPEDYVFARLATCGSALVLCALYCLFQPAWTRYETVCVAVYMIFRTGEALSDENQALQQNAGRMDYVCLSFLARGVLMLGSFVGVMLWKKDLLTAFCAMSVSTGLVVLFYEFPVSRRLTAFRVEPRWKSGAALLRENIPLMLNTLMMTACVSVPRTALKRICGNWWLGIYGFIAAPAAVAQSAALWLFMPSLTAFGRYWHEKDKASFMRLHRRILILLGALSAVILLAGKLFGGWALNLLFGAEVAAQEALLLPTLATTVLIAGEYYLSALLTVARNMRIILISNAAGMVLTLALTNAMIQKWGAAGVNGVICVSMGTMVLIQAVGLHFCLKRRFDGKAGAKD